MVTNVIFNCCRSSDTSAHASGKSTGRNKSQSPAKPSSPVKRKSPKKRVAKINPHQLKVRITPPKKTFTTPSPIVKPKKNTPDSGSPAEQSPHCSKLPKQNKDKRLKSDTSAHGSTDTDDSPPPHTMGQARKKKDLAPTTECSTGVVESPVTKPLLKALGLQEKQNSPGDSADIKPPRRESPRLRQTKLSLTNKGKRVSWDLGKSQQSPIEISPSSDETTPVRGKCSVRRTTLSQKFSPQKKSSSASPSTSRKKNNDIEYQNKTDNPLSKSSEPRVTSEPKSKHQQKRKSNQKKYTSDFEDSTSDQQDSSPMGATSNTDEDEALIRSTDIKPQLRSIAEQLSDLDNHSPLYSDDSSDTSTEMQTRSSGGNKWTYKKIKLLCCLWEEEEHLYNPKHPQYLNKKLRIKAHLRMSAALDMDGNYCSCEM